jgi:hypothetical protein
MANADVHAPRPWVQVAAFCKTSIIGNDGALSVIQIADRIGLGGFTPEMQPTPLQLTMALVLKSDEMRGQYQVRIRCIAPSGKTTLGPEIPFLFEGEDRGVQAVLPIGLFAAEKGLYWFEILIEDDVLTRVPLRVLYQRIQMPPGIGQFGPGTPSPEGPPQS